MSELMSQKEIDKLLEEIAAGQDISKPVEKVHKIKIYDFKRPTRFSREELRNIQNTSETFSKKLTKFFATEYDIFPKFKVLSVDDLTCEEYIRSLPAPTPCFNFSWMDGEGIFELDYEIFFKGFMGANPKKKRDLNGIEKNVFENCVFNPIAQLLQKEFSGIVKKELPKITNQEFYENTNYMLKLNSSVEMGILVTFEVAFKNIERQMTLFLTQELVDSLRENDFFLCQSSYQKRDTIIIPVTYPEPNTMVEVGRFRLEDDFKIQKNMVFETNKLAGDPLDIYKNGTHVALGEAVVVDDNLGVRITKLVEEPKEETFYNTKIVFGGRTTTPEEQFADGVILQLTECWNDRAKVIKDNKLIAYGEIIIVDESIGIKITEVVG